MATGGLLVAGVGCGLTAHGATAGGADLLACYATACHRAKGLPSALSFLPYGDANEFVLAALPEVLAAAHVPVLAGIGAHDPRRDLRGIVDQVVARGAAGVMNEPFIGMYPGPLRRQLEDAGLGYQRELDLITTAVESGLHTLGWAWNADDARRMAATGTGLLGAMLGISNDPDRDSSSSLDAAGAIVSAARDENPDVRVVLHGGPLTEPDYVREAVYATGAQGYMAGSTVERVPTVTSIAEAVRRFQAAARATP